jgi:hypothetical protein
MTKEFEHMAESKTVKKNFGLIDAEGNEVGIYSGAQPRDAALKAANKGIKDIVLREKGTKKLHYFKGERKLVPCPASAPQWMKDAAKSNNGKIWKANVTKVGTAKLDWHELEKNDKALFKVPAKKI